MQDDFAVFGTFDGLLIRLFQESDGLVYALIQLLEGLFSILVHRDFRAGQPCRAALGGILGNLDLARESEHIRRQPGIQ